ncbi:membrane protein ORF124 [Cyprinid herpesvirus 3]|uniref:Membrane protein ORF124 n=1 Tax=Cyprinid herpesvirus 3 TaxID=180230 RepID=A3QMU2_CYHV3|nr:unnamed protein product [Cyprinid herpesvirus 3]ABC55121.1 hypothetical protein [Cyprinid herpesvirus 3]ABG42951.1 membrane protein ORF124 [Cyprinid herpesvirus 3]AIC32479.1 ORF124R [Cyprinid herpesvirus 3]AJP55611.1 membrane protein ORF124 [Cyprinid herpesvirus 3]AJP55766.1 membrane protein ORF124 [Cyprinid herpesvirus 3]
MGPLTIYTVLILVSPQDNSTVTLTAREGCLWRHGGTSELTVEVPRKDYASTTSNQLVCTKAGVLLRVEVGRYLSMTEWMPRLLDSVRYSADGIKNSTYFVRATPDSISHILATNDEHLATDEGGPEMPGVYYNTFSGKHYAYYPLGVRAESRDLGEDRWTVRCVTTWPATAELVVAGGGGDGTRMIQMDESHQITLPYHEAYGAWCRAKWLTHTTSTYVMTTPSSSVLLQLILMVLMVLGLIYARKAMRSRMGGIQLSVVRPPTKWLFAPRAVLTHNGELK